MLWAGWGSGPPFCPDQPQLLLFTETFTAQPNEPGFQGSLSGVWNGRLEINAGSPSAYFIIQEKEIQYFWCEPCTH